MQQPRVIPVVTCMGRLSHLMETLPLIGRSFEKVVLVDFSCPESSGNWAKATLSNVHVERLEGENEWHKPRAINRGIGAARALGADWVLCIDADTRIRTGFREAISACTVPGRFAIAPRTWPGPTSDPELCGLLLVSMSDLDRVGLFDEQFRGWGGDDIEMRCRLCLVGHLMALDLPQGVVAPIRHRDRERTKFTGESKSNWLRQHRLQLGASIERWTGRSDWHKIPDVHSLLCHPTVADAQRLMG